MKKILTAIVTFIMCSAFTCSAPTDPYATARLVINGTQIAVQTSEGVFMLWAATQTDPEKVKTALAKFTKVKVAVLQGLQVALDGVDIAQQAKTDPDIRKLMVAAETAFQDLRRLLEELLTKPASQPVAKGVKALQLPLSEPEQMFLKLPRTLLK